MKRTRLRRLAIVVLLIVLMPAAMLAQEQPRTGLLPLRITDAVTEALARNPELAALRLEYEAMRAVPLQERSLAPPMLETQIWGWPITTLNPVRTDMYMFMAEQELPGRGKRASRALVAERDADVSRHQVVVRANEILRDVKQAYVDLALARETAVIVERQAPVLEDMAEAATLRYAAGLGVQHHTVAFLVELSSLQTERIGAEEQARLAEARLNALLGRSPSQTVESLAPLALSVNPADAEALALKNYPDLALAAATVAKEEADLARLQGDRRPDFVVGGGYMLIPGEPGAWTARAGLTWPNAPWSRGRINAAIDVQARRLAAARARQDALALTIRRGVREAVVRMAAAQQRMDLLESTIVPQIEHAFELTRVTYTSGEGEFTDVLESRRLLLAAQVEQAAARAELDRASADLEAMMGVQ